MRRPFLAVAAAAGLTLCAAASASTSALKTRVELRTLELRCLQDPTDDRSRLELAAAQARAGQWPQAAGTLEALLARRPDDARVLGALGRAREAQGDLVGARDSLRRAVALAPASATARERLARVVAALRERAAPFEGDALAAYERGEPVVAARSCDAALAVDPESTTGLLVKGLLFDDYRQVDDALLLYRKVLAADPSEARAAARLARLEVERGELRSAEAHLRVALSSPAGGVDARVAEAELRAAQNRCDEAQAAIGRALALRPDDAELLMLRFRYELRLQDYGAARRTLEVLGRVVPGRPEVAYLEGVLADRLGDADGALERLGDYLSRAPQGALRVRALATVAAELERRGRWREALEHLDLAAKAAPGDEAVAAQRATVQERWRLAEAGRRERRGPFEYHYLQGTEAALLDEVDEAFQGAARRVCPELGAAPGAVQVTLLVATPSSLPAFCDVRTGELVISRAFFEGDRPASRRALGRYLITHEFTHYLTRHAVGAEAFTGPNLWVLEGLAEHYADALAVQPPDVAVLFADGLFAWPRLAASLAVSSAGEAGDRAAAYVQACCMVEAVLERSPADGVRRLLSLVRDQAAGAPLEDSFRRHLGRSPDEVLADARALIDRRWLSRRPAAR